MSINNLNNYQQPVAGSIDNTTKDFYNESPAKSIVLMPDDGSPSSSTTLGSVFTPEGSWSTMGIENLIKQSFSGELDSKRAPSTAEILDTSLNIYETALTTKPSPTSSSSVQHHNACSVSTEFDPFVYNNWTDVQLIQKDTHAGQRRPTKQPSVIEISLDHDVSPVFNDVSKQPGSNDINHIWNTVTADNNDSASSSGVYSTARIQPVHPQSESYCNWSTQHPLASVVDVRRPILTSQCVQYRSPTHGQPSHAPAHVTQKCSSLFKNVYSTEENLSGSMPNINECSSIMKMERTHAHHHHSGQYQNVPKKRPSSVAEEQKIFNSQTVYPAFGNSISTVPAKFNCKSLELEDLSPVDQQQNVQWYPFSPHEIEAGDIFYQDQILQLQGSTDFMNKDAQLKRNRISAWNYRARKKHERDLLFDRIKLLEKEKLELQVQTSVISAELANLRTSIDTHHRTHNCLPITKSL